LHDISSLNVIVVVVVVVVALSTCVVVCVVTISCARIHLLERYDVLEVIGQGSFGVVRKCQDKHTHQVCAVKTILKAKVPDARYLRQEVETLLDCWHPHIVHLEDVYEDKKYIHIVTELCTGGSLYDRICASQEYPELQFTEAQAAHIVGQILDAISYCHDVKNIVHRDLKAENFLFLSHSADAPIKIIDFGFSRHTFDVMTSRVVSYPPPKNRIQRAGQKPFIKKPFDPLLRCI
jgi:serine/threonine protein kinase